ncbi:pollen-specific leucine-rich repeat extensin-like protein 1 [Arachis stenosperma]|uniref:pollen-specific leucine-rich repeat extensin-like protein 1 n=1 Tax=Arachis stenosperma TaxID=217475 RepID=UPI0025ACA919|nr:pollen-specific leucine-rich repeat extensin-like protein 1 [Arachis stenosperma]
MGTYNSTYQFIIQPVPSREYWEHVDLPPVLPPVYKKQIGRPKSKKDKKNDAPKEPTPDPHRPPRKYGPITCKYCLKTGHNSCSCSKKKEAMAGSAGEQSASQHPPAADDEVEAARLEEMFWEETLEAVEVAKAAATQPPPESTPVRQPIPNPAMSPLIRPPTTIRPPKKKKNVRRPPPTSQQPRPPQPTLNPTTPTTSSPSPLATDVPPTVTPQTMQAASQGTTSRFLEFMPTPTVRVSTSRRWPQPAFRPPAKKGSTTAHLKEGSSGSSNSTPIP